MIVFLNPNIFWTLKNIVIGILCVFMMYMIIYHTLSKLVYIFAINPFLLI